MSLFRVFGVHLVPRHLAIAGQSVSSLSPRAHLPNLFFVRVFHFPNPFFFCVRVGERCDNCQGHFTDISNRMDQFYQRLFDRGWALTKSVWAVPQAFGNERSVAFFFAFLSFV